jgi:hypothetical protein
MGFPMKPLSLRKTITLAAAALIGLGAVVAAIVWVRLNHYMNQPGFGERLAREMSEALEGDVRLVRASGRLGWRPWVTLEGFSFSGQGDQVRLSAEKAHVTAKLGPLLFGRLTLSSVDVISPALSLRRSQEGVWPVPGASLRSRGKEEKGGLSIRFQKVNLKDVTISFVDGSSSDETLVTLRGDLTLGRIGDNVRLDFFSRVESVRGPGRIAIKGILHPEMDLRVEADHIPLGAVHSIAPAFTPFGGTVDFSLRLWKDEKRVLWESQGTVKDPFVIATSTALPLSLRWDVQSEGDSQVIAHWLSDDTDLTGAFTLDDISSPALSLAVTGPRLSLDEVVAVGDLFKGGGTSTAPWTLTLSWSIDSMRLGPLPLREVKGKAILQPDRGTISRLEAKVPGGTAVLSGGWRTASRGTRLSAQLDAKSLDVTSIGEVLGSSITASGLVSVTARCEDFPLPALPVSPDQILDAILRSREVQGRLTTTSLQIDQAEIDDFEINVSQAQKKARATLVLNGAKGRMEGFYEGHFKEGGVVHQATVSVAGVDLSLVRPLVERWGVQAGIVNASSHWQWTDGGDSSSLGRSSAAVWSAEVALQGALWRGLPSETLRARIDWDGDGALRLTELEGKISKGNLRAEGEWIPAGVTSSSFHVDVQASDVEVGPLMLAFSSRPFLLQGLASGALTVSGEARPWREESVQGHLFLNGRDGLFAQSPTGLKVLSELKLGSLFKIASGQRVPGLPFDILEASAPIRNGRVLFDHPAVLRNPDIELAYTGWVNLGLSQGEGSLIVNALTGTRDLLQKVPGVSQILFGPNGEFLPIVIDISYNGENVKTNVRSIQSLTGPVTSVIKNIFKLPGRIFGLNKKSASETP